MEEEPWGWHLVLDAGNCDRDKVTDPENVANFARALVKRIDMIAYGEPQVIRFGEDDKYGLTLVQLITTSNIVAHFCDSSGDGYIDIFSCREFNTEDAVAVVQEFFNPETVIQHFLKRQAAPPIFPK